MKEKGWLGGKRSATAVTGRIRKEKEKEEEIDRGRNATAVMGRLRKRGGNVRDEGVLRSTSFNFQKGLRVTSLT